MHRIQTLWQVVCKTSFYLFFKKFLLLVVCKTSVLLVLLSISSFAFCHQAETGLLGKRCYFCFAFKQDVIKSKGRFFLTQLDLLALNLLVVRIQHMLSPEDGYNVIRTKGQAFHHLIYQVLTCTIFCRSLTLWLLLLQLLLTLSRLPRMTTRVGWYRRHRPSPYAPSAIPGSTSMPLRLSTMPSPNIPHLPNAMPMR